MKHRIIFALRLLLVLAVMAFFVWAFMHIQASERFP
jgi:hypothetical protein